MIKIKKIIALNLVIALLSTTFQPVFALDLSGFDKTNSDEKIELANGEYVYYNVKDNTTGKQIYLYETAYTKTKMVDLGQYGVRSMMYGQYQFLDGLDNGGIPNNIAKLKTAEGWNSALKLRMTYNSQNLISNDQNVIGSSYLSYENINTNKNFTYPESGNYSFKSWTSGDKKITDPTPDLLKQFYFNPNAKASEQFGNPRYTLDMDFNQQSAFGFMPDTIGSPEEGWNMTYKNVLKFPWTESVSTPKGYVNILYDRLKSTYGNNELATWKDSKFSELSNFYLLTSYHLAVTEATSDDFKAKLATLTANKARNKTNESDRMKTMLEYFSIYSFGGHGYGSMAGVHKGSNGIKYYFGIGTPRQYGQRDIIFGGNFGSGEYQYIGENENLVYRVREYDSVTKTLGKILDNKVDKLKIDKNYMVEWFIAVKKLEADSQNETYHSNIQNDFSYKLNTSTTILGEEKNISGYKINYDSITGEAEITKDSQSGKVQVYNDTYYKDELNNSEGVIGYQQLITVPAKDNTGLKASRISFNSKLSDFNNYYRADGSPDKNDNLNTNRDYSGIAFDVSESSEDFLVSHSQNKNTPSSIDGFPNSKITKVNNIPYTNQELKPSDIINAEIYAQRNADSQVPVKFSDLKMWTEEYPDSTAIDLSVKVDADTLYTTNYNNTTKYTANAPKLVKYKTYNSVDNTYSDWIDYIASSMQNNNVDAGTILMYELQNYKIPSMSDIQADTAKWNTNVPALYMKSSYAKLTLGFELSTLATADPNILNNWGRLDLVVGKPAVRNMVMTEITLFDENGTRIQTFNDDKSGTKSFNVNTPLDATKNYYVEVKTKFDFPYDTKKSIGSNLRTTVVSYFNGIPPADQNDPKYRAVSNLTTQWNDKEIGVYNPKTSYSGIDVKTYNPSTSPFNPLIIPLKFNPSATEGTVWVKIPDINTATDNQIVDAWDMVNLQYFVGTPSIKDNEITDIQMFNTSGQEYKTVTDDNYQLLDPNKSYYSLITVTRKVGNKDNMVDLNPKLNVKVFTENTSNYYTQTLSPFTGTQLKNVGDKIIYKLTGLVSPTNYIKIEADFPNLDANMENNRRDETWANIYDFHVRDLLITPDKIQMGKDEYTKSSDHTFSFYAGFDTNGATQVLSNVPVVIEEWQRTTGDFTYARTVYSTLATLSNDSEIQLSGTITNATYSPNMDKKYIVKINGGIAGTQTYNMEKIRTNNEDYAYTSSFKQETLVLDCTNLRSSNTWKADFQRTQYTGGTNVTKQFTRLVTNADGSTTSIPYTRVVAEPMGTPTVYNETRQFNEELSFKAMFKATGMNSYVDLMTNPSAGVVRAGEKFDLYLQVVYATNRDNYPWKGQIQNRPPANPDWSNANFNPITDVPRLSGVFNISSSQVETYPDLYPNSISGYGTKTYTYYPFKTRYIPASTSNLNMKFNLQTDELTGYFSDPYHPKLIMKICPSFTIEISGGIPYQTGTSTID